jgi:hypothetical protein
LRGLHRRQVNLLRYYLYVSDAKLDMLFEQIDQRVLKHISTEVKVDLKLASITLRKAENPTPARMAKLQIVERFIDEHHDVGTYEDPGRGYFRGQMDMQWGWLTSPRHDASTIVFFRGEGDSQIVMLAGSGRHVIGEPPNANAFAGSALPHIIAAVSEHISDKSAIAGLPSESPEWTRPLRASEARLYPKDTPTQRMEFLAIPLVEDRMADVHMILGTPLYVALASEMR